MKYHMINAYLTSASLAFAFLLIGTPIGNDFFSSIMTMGKPSFMLFIPIALTTALVLWAYVQSFQGRSFLAGMPLIILLIALYLKLLNVWSLGVIDRALMIESQFINRMNEFSASLNTTNWTLVVLNILPGSIILTTLLILGNRLIDCFNKKTPKTTEPAALHTVFVSLAIIISCTLPSLISFGHFDNIMEMARGKGQVFIMGSALMIGLFIIFCAPSSRNKVLLFSTSLPLLSLYGVMKTGYVMMEYNAIRERLFEEGKHLDKLTPEIYDLNYELSYASTNSVWMIVIVFLSAYSLASLFKPSGRPQESGEVTIIS